MTMDELYARGFGEGKRIRLHLGSYIAITVNEGGREIYETPTELSLIWNRQQFLNAYKEVKTQKELEDLVNSASQSTDSQPAQP